MIDEKEIESHVIAKVKNGFKYCSSPSKGPKANIELKDVEFLSDNKLKITTRATSKNTGTPTAIYITCFNLYIYGTYDKFNVLNDNGHVVIETYMTINAKIYEERLINFKNQRKIYDKLVNFFNTHKIKTYTSNNNSYAINTYKLEHTINEIDGIYNIYFSSSEKKHNICNYITLYDISQKFDYEFDFEDSNTLKIVENRYSSDSKEALIGSDVTIYYGEKIEQ